MENRIKVTFVIPSLRPGGAERVMSYIAQNLNKHLFEVTLLVIGYSKKASYDITGINLVFLNKPRVLVAFWPIFKHLYKSKPDIVISAITHVNTLMGIQSLWFKKTKFVGREVNVLSVLNNVQAASRKYPFSISGLTERSYKLLDIILCQSQDMATDMIHNFNAPKDKIRIINNPISDLFKPKEKQVDNKISKFITVGSLVTRKGHDRLLNALSKFEGPFEYYIIGDGDKSGEIFGLAEVLSLTNKIIHIPFTKDVSKYLKESDVFLQGSYVEGFPNALLESCAVGTPVLAFDALGGINEIVEEGINGFVAKDESDFLLKLDLITKRTWDPKEVSDSVIKKYNKEKILKDYENLFLELTK
ncbi:glycosyltransferase [Confluentibacter lentus]|uniref:glycosyltransferase n=1 Tax=Confluentibacter lentus TaxID=1699412 RepID=UPI000C2955E8|nr:glycosyltransferase [Confluentibacter lentus]